MLSQIELGKSMPTIGVLWKIATALNVTFATLTSAGAVGRTTLLRSGRAKILSSSQGKFVSRALSIMDGERRTEFYELNIAAGHEEAADAHAPGTIENIVVLSGKLEIFDGLDWHQLAQQDAIVFEADLPHVYRNAGTSATIAYLVMSYADTIG